MARVLDRGRSQCVRSLHYCGRDLPLVSSVTHVRTLESPTSQSVADIFCGMKVMRQTPVLALLGSALLTMACASTARPPLAVPPREPALAITDAMLWDGTGRPAVPHAVTLVRGSRILCAGALGECQVPRDAHLIDAHGGWLIPGLIDTHVHLLFLRPGSASTAMGDDLKDLLAQGVTSVRDMGTNPAELLSRTRALGAAPRVSAMQLIAGFRFFYGAERVAMSDGSTGYRLPQAQVMEMRGWTPMVYHNDDDADSLVAVAKATGATGLKLYAYLDPDAVRSLVEAGHRAGMSVWGHAWVQPANPRELVLAGEDGIVHASLFIGDLFSRRERDNLRGMSAILESGARTATAEAALDPRIGETLDSMARRGTFFEPTLDVTLRSVAHYEAEHADQPSVSEEYARASVAFSMAVTREAVKRGVRITAGTDHVAYGPVSDRASLHGELQLLVDSIGMSPTAALLAATRNAAIALGEEQANSVGTIEAGRYADLVLLSKSPLENIRNLDAIEWVMQDGKLWRPWQLRSGIATGSPADSSGLVWGTGSPVMR
jgi:imidazolonepropionase-like amidohydrolase